MSDAQIQVRESGVWSGCLARRVGQSCLLFVHVLLESLRRLRDRLSLCASLPFAIPQGRSRRSRWTAARVGARELAKWRAMSHGSESSIGGGRRIYRACSFLGAARSAELACRECARVEVPALQRSRWRGSVARSRREGTHGFVTHPLPLVAACAPPEPTTTCIPLPRRCLSSSSYHHHQLA